MGICFSAPAAAEASSNNDDFSALSSREQLKRQDEKIATILRIAETQVDSSGALTASQGQIEKRYKMGKLLGKGAFGAVQLCTRKPDGYKNGDRPVPGQNVGIKVRPSGCCAHSHIRPRRVSPSCAPPPVLPLSGHFEVKVPGR